MLALLGLLLSCLPSSGPPVFGRDRLDHIKTVEGHGEFLARWAADGVRDATLVNLDAHHDLRPIPQPDVKALRGLLARRDFKALSAVCSLGDEGLYDDGSFVFAGVALGIIREVIWVVPFLHSGPAPPLAEDRALLEGTGVPPRDAPGFVREGGCLGGRLAGVPLRVCGIESLPPIAGPILLSLDVDFLPALAGERDVGPHSALRTTLGLLAARRYEVQSACVAASIADGYVAPMRRWIADVAVAAMADFSSLAPGKAPEAWELLDRVDDLTVRGRQAEVVRAVQPQLADSRFGAAFAAYLADARYLMDDLEGALVAARHACLKDHRYCVALPDLGRALALEGRVDQAARFFRAADSLAPEVHPWLAESEMALACVRAGSRAEALKHLGRVRASVRSYSAEFLIAQQLQLEGDGAAADAHLEKALELSRHPRFEEPRGPEIGEAVRWAMDRLQRAGRRWEAEELRRAPALGWALTPEARDGT